MLLLGSLVYFSRNLLRGLHKRLAQLEVTWQPCEEGKVKNETKRKKKKRDKKKKCKSHTRSLAAALERPHTGDVNQRNLLPTLWGMEKEGSQQGPLPGC